MIDRRSDGLTTLLIAVLIGVFWSVAAAGALWMASIGCDRAWAGSGMRSHYKVLAGCLIETAPNHWIPEKQYRAIHEEPQP